MLETGWRALMADLNRHFVYHPKLGRWGKWKLALTVDGIWAMIVYRLGRSLRARRGSIVTRFAWPLYRSAELAVRVATGVHLDVDAEIGPGFYIGHFGSIYVGPGVVMGPLCSISQMCFVGAGGPEAGPGAPRIGSRVYLGAGAKVVGGVQIDSGAAIGANAVVISDVPENGVAAGIPAALVSTQGSGDFIYLGDASQASSLNR